MSLWIKICGNTTLADARLAVDAGADAVGFVLAASPRRVSVEQVRVITLGLPDSIEKIGVFVDVDFAAAAAAIEQCRLTGVQLHFEGDHKLTAQLRERFGASLRILRVVHFGEGAASQMQAVAVDENIDGILVDSRTATAVGGTGIAFDWRTARETLFSGSDLKLIAAGGLSPENVAGAIAMLRPWGVDVVSGVESSPGHKDAAKVHAFVAKARAAASGS